jgi:hypothetical protein
MVAGANGAGNDVHAVRALLKSREDVSHVYLASAWKPDQLDGCRVLNAQSPGRITCHVGAIVARKQRQLRLKTVTNIRHPPLSDSYGWCPSKDTPVLAQVI